MDRSENINEHAKYKIDKTIIAEITLIHEITNVSGKLVFVLISNDMTSWFKTLDITTPENRPIKIAEIIYKVKTKMILLYIVDINIINKGIDVKILLFKLLIILHQSFFLSYKIY